MSQKQGPCFVIHLSFSCERISIGLDILKHLFNPRVHYYVQKEISSQKRLYHLCLHQDETLLHLTKEKGMIVQQTRRHYLLDYQLAISSFWGEYGRPTTMMLTLALFPCAALSPKTRKPPQSQPGHD
jgi:hypothetical protein